MLFCKNTTYKKHVFVMAKIVSPLKFTSFRYNWNDAKNH